MFLGENAPKFQDPILLTSTKFGGNCSQKRQKSMHTTRPITQKSLSFLIFWET